MLKATEFAYLEFLKGTFIKLIPTERPLYKSVWGPFENHLPKVTLTWEQMHYK